jgi:hypothetical protein
MQIEIHEPVLVVGRAACPAASSDLWRPVADGHVLRSAPTDGRCSTDVRPKVKGAESWTAGRSSTKSARRWPPT